MSKVYIIKEHYDDGTVDFDKSWYVKDIMVAETEKKAKDFIRHYKPDVYGYKWVKGDPLDLFCDSVKKIAIRLYHKKYSRWDDYYEMLWYSIEEMEMI